MPSANVIPSRFAAPFADSLIYLIGRFCPVEQHCILMLGGRIDESRLRKAVRRSLDAEPVLGCRFVEHWLRPHWQRRVDLDDCPLCGVVEATDTSAELARFLSARIDPRRDPLVQVRILRGEKDTICIKLAHEVGDGPSARNYYRLLLGLYEQLKKEPDYEPSPNLGPRNMEGISSRFSLWEKLGNLRTILRQRRSVQRGGSWRRAEARGDGSRQGCLRMKIDPVRTAALIQYGRDCGGSITSVMLAGCCRAAREVFEPVNREVASIGTTVDLRRFLPPERLPTAVSNVASPMRLWFPPDGKVAFDELVKGITGQLEVLSDPARAAVPLPLVLLYPLIERTAPPFAIRRRNVARKAMARMAHSTFDTFLVNGGRLDVIADEFHELPVDDIFTCGPLIDIGMLLLDFSGFRGALRVAMRFSDRIISEPKARRLLEEVDRALPFFSGTQATIDCLSAERQTGAPAAFCDSPGRYDSTG